MRRAGLVLGFMLLSLPAHAADQVRFAWEFPRGFTPQPVSFQLSYVNSAAATQAVEAMTVPPSAVGACGGGEGEDVYCAAWPACPAAETVLVVWVEAVWAAARSEKSNIAVCTFTAAQPCVCLTTESQAVEAGEPPREEPSPGRNALPIPAGEPSLAALPMPAGAAGGAT